VIVLLDGKSTEAALPNMAAGMVVLVVPADMGREQPHHVSAQVVVLAWPNREVKMIAHQTKSKQPHVQALARFLQQLEKGLEIAVLMENGSLAVAAVEDVITITSLGSAGSARHGGNYGASESWLQENKYDVPFSAPWFGVTPRGPRRITCTPRWMLRAQRRPKPMASNAGQIVGAFETESLLGPRHGFLLSSGAYTQLGGGPEGTVSLDASLLVAYG
jgi:hypothetical protein